MKVTFQHPKDWTIPQSPNNFKDPLNQFDPSNSNHYPPMSGVYIYGLKLDVAGEKVFVPLGVGTSYKNTRSIKIRLQTHYKSNKSTSKSTKAKFDFSASTYSLQDIKDIYNDMKIFDSLSGGTKTTLAAQLSTLIYFQNLQFYYHKFSINPVPPKNNMDDNSMSIYFSKHSNSNFNTIGKKIQAKKAQYDKNFYYIYAAFPEDFINFEEILSQSINNNTFLEAVEHETKKELEKQGIFTTAKHVNRDLDVEIELSKVIDIFVKL